ncbi:MAG TPA: prolipoprotein diacylglyceryl transferase family protein [Candidatus Limnocylindrales bacterium]
MPAAVRLDFDPSTTVLGTAVRLDMLALAGVIFLVLVITALRAGRSDAAASTDGAEPARRLRRDDLILIAFGAVPGAVIGGRLGYGLIHLDYYRTDLSTLFDPGRGGMELTLAVLLGSLTAISVARLLAAPIGRWLSVAAVPLLVGLGLGKLTMVLGGAGQGLYSDASYATYYARPGPWGSANADLAAVPSQALEGVLVLAIVGAVLVVPFLLRLRFPERRITVRPALAPRRDWAMLTGGRRFLTVLGLWAAARLVAVFTWRDGHVLGPLAAEQMILIAVLVLAFGGPLVVPGWRRARVGVPAWRIARRERLVRAAESKAATAAEAAELTRLAAEAKAAAEVKEAEQAHVTAEEVRLATEAKAAEEARAPEATATEEARLATEAKAAEVAAAEAYEAEEAEKVVQTKAIYSQP